MKTRTLALMLAGGLACLSGCKTSTSNRVVYTTQPAVVAASPAPVAVVAPVAPVPVAAPAPAPCSSCGNAAATVPPPPPGFVR